MMTVDFFAALVILMLSGGRQTDVVSFLPARDYFHARHIPVTVDKMLALAAQRPTTAKAEVQQLLAMRMLGDMGNKLAKSSQAAQVRKALSQWADGQHDSDALGFAQQYAVRALARLSGANPRPIRGGSLDDALHWLPPDACLVGLLRSHNAEPALRQPEAPSIFRRFLSERDREGLFRAVERIGNVKIDYVAFAIEQGKGKSLSEDGRFLIHIAGKVNHARLQALLRSTGLVLQTKPRHRGRPVAAWQTEDNKAAVILVGNTDLLLVGTADPQRLRATVDAALARGTMEIHKPEVSPLLRHVPPLATFLVSGRVREGNDNYEIHAHWLPGQRALHVEADLTFPTEMQAERAEAGVRWFTAELKSNFPQACGAVGVALAVEQVKGKPLTLAPRALDVQAITASFDNIKAQAQANKLHEQAVIPDHTWVGVFSVYRGMFTMLNSLQEMFDTPAAKGGSSLLPPGRPTTRPPAQSKR